MEPTDAARVHTEDQRFERPYALADRFLDNIETVVYGKREEVKLVVAAMICGGHVLFEDVPGTAKTVLARAIAQSIEGATTSRIQCTPDLQPTDVTGLVGLRPEGARVRVPARPDLRERRPRRRDQPRDAEDAVGAARGDGRAARSRSTARRASCRSRSSSWRPRTRSSTRGRSRSPRRSSTASSCAPRSATRRPTTSCEILHEQRHGHPLGRLRAALDLDEIEELRVAAQDVYVDARDPALDRRPRPRDARASKTSSIGASVRGIARARARRSRLGAPARTLVRRARGRGAALPAVLVHRVVFRPAFLAEARRTGWDAALDAFRERCLERAPPPAARRRRPSPSSRTSPWPTPTVPSRSSRGAGSSASPSAR